MSSPTHLECPRCALALFSGGTLDVDMFGCAKCCGIWIDNRGCHRLVSGTFPAPAREQILNTTRHAADTRQPSANYRKRAVTTEATCPVCSQTLHSYTTSKNTHGVSVHLDVCADHGTWFDQGEAWILLQAVELKRLALRADIETALRAREEAEGTAAWTSFIGGIVLDDD